MSIKKTATSILIVMVIVCAAFAAGFVTGNKPPDLTAQELAQALDTHSNKNLRPYLEEANTTFTYQGSPIHPLLVKEFEIFLSDNTHPVTVAIDIISASKADNEYDQNSVYETNGRVGVSLEEGGYYEYEVLESTKDGTQVVKTYDCGGGSGVFTSIYLIRFETDTALDTNGLMYERLLMKVVGEKQ